MAGTWWIPSMENGWSVILLREESYAVVPFFSFLFMFPSLFLFIPPSDYVTEEIVTCFHEYAMKKYEVLASCHSNSKEKVVKCSIITNPNCGKHTPNNYCRKHISVLCDIIKTEKQRKGKGTVPSSMKSENETLISKLTRPANTGKESLTATLQICHLFLQKLDTGVYGLNGWLNSLHEKGSGNLT